MLGDCLRIADWPKKGIPINNWATHARRCSEGTADQEAHINICGSPALTAIMPSPNQRAVTHHICCRSSPTENSLYLNFLRNSLDTELDDDRYVETLHYCKCNNCPFDKVNPHETGEIDRLRNLELSSKVRRRDTIILSEYTDTSSITALPRKEMNEGEIKETREQASVDTPHRLEASTSLRVAFLGDSQVGKTSLLNQFMASEFITSCGVNNEDEDGLTEKRVSVLIENSRNEVVFVDHSFHEISAENCLSTYQPQACIVVYSITNRGSFETAKEILHYLSQENEVSRPAVILVGNKVDLARCRAVSTNEGRTLATVFKCKFIETSSGIRHNVDKLLFGTVKQVRLRIALSKHKKNHFKKPSEYLEGAKQVMAKVFPLVFKSKSCQNFLVL